MMGKWWDSHGENDDPPVKSQFANLKMAIEIVDLPIKNGYVPIIAHGGEWLLQ